jgi:hypothetical protein
MQNFGVEKDQTAIRIALRAFHRDYMFEGKAFRPLKNGNTEKPKTEDGAES